MLVRQRCLMGFASYHEAGYRWYEPREAPNEATTGVSIEIPKFKIHFTPGTTTIEFKSPE